MALLVGALDPIDLVNHIHDSTPLPMLHQLRSLFWRLLTAARYHPCMGILNSIVIHLCDGDSNRTDLTGVSGALSHHTPTEVLS